jgi:hypothetical protein
VITPLDWAVSILLLAAAAVVVAWVAGAIYYDVCGATRLGRWAAWAWVAGAVAAFVLWQPVWEPFVALVAVTGVFLLWWVRLRPSHDREWEPSVAVLPRATRDGDVVTFENVRNFEYRSLADYTPRYETRAYRLSNLRGADVIFFNWGVPLMSHPVLVFDFGPDGRVCVSIEVRFRRGQGFSITRSLYRQQELIFVVADERDVILRRTKYAKPQQAHLYRLAVPLDQVRASFLDYVATVNSLSAAPRWYHGVCMNCTTAFYRLPNSRWWLEWRILANGRLDRALYDDGRLDRSVPFDVLRRNAYLTDVANAAPEAGFGDRIRAELERRHER